MRHTRRMTAQNMAALAFSALTSSATLAQTNATDLPLPPSRDGYAGQCSYPYKRPRCPAPFERYIIGERVWLEQDAGGLKKGMHEALVEGGKCYFVPFKEEYPMLADSPEWEEMAQNCSVLKMPPGYVAEPPPPDGRIMKDRAANIARYNRMKELEAAAEAADRARQQAEARTQEATPLPASASPVLPNGQKWYQVPNYLPPVVDYNNLTSTQQVINPGTVYKEVHCQLSNGLKVEPGSGLILDNRMLVYVERQNCSLTPMVEVVQGGQSPSTFPTAQPLLEALEKTIPTSSALFSGELGAAQDIGTKFYPGKAIVAPFGPMAGFSALITAQKPALGIPPHQPIRVEVGNDCKLPDGKTAKPGDGYIPADKSGIYEIKADCTFKTIAKRQDVRVYKGTDGVAKGYYALPSNSATSIGRGVITIPLPPDQSPIPAGILPPMSASQRLVPFAQESVPAAFVAVGAGEAGVGLVAGLEATLGRTAAQGVMLIPQVRAAIIATGAATIAAVAVKKIYNWIATPEAIPASPIIPDLNDVAARFRKAELPVTAENATLEPPGNCGQEEFDEIRNRKERFCKVADNDGFKLGCVKEQFTTVIGIEKRIEQLDNCTKAREDEAMCMAGGNQGHKTELKNRLTDLFLCVKRLHAFPKVTP